MSDYVVEIRDLSRRFGRLTALHDVTMDVPRGCVLGLVGENGAGKTTLIKHLLGLFKPQQGTVTVFGLDPVRDPVGVLGRVGYLSENRDIPQWMRVSQLIDYSQAFYPNWDAEFAGQLQHMFELDGRQKIRTLSRGQRARAGLLIALAHRPELLVLDEPSSGLDPLVRRDILTAIIRTVADEGRTVVFSSHLLGEVERVADCVAIMHRGRKLLSDPLDRVLAEHRVVLLRFVEPQRVPPELPGALLTSGEGREWTVVCNGQFEQMQAAAQAVGGSIVEQRRPSLEEVFVARIGKS